MSGKTFKKGWKTSLYLKETEETWLYAVCGSWYDQETREHVTRMWRILLEWLGHHDLDNWLRYEVRL